MSPTTTQLARPRLRPGEALPTLTMLVALAPSLGAGQAAGVGLTVCGDEAFDGYTLIAPLNSTSTFLLDMDGEVAHRWDAECTSTGAVYLLDSGNLLRCGRQADIPRFQGGGIGGRLQELDWDGNVVWEHVIADERRTHHHDVEPLPGGTLLAIVWEYHSREEAIARGRDPSKVDAKGFWPDAILELRPIRPRGAEIVWEWHAWDHVVQDRSAALEHYGSIPEHPGRIDIDADHRGRPPMTEDERERLEEMERQMRALGYTGGELEEDPIRPMRAPDWLHSNSIDYLPEYDLIALSPAHMNELWVIDHSTTSQEAAGSTGGRWGRGGEILWRWGNPRNHGAGTDQDRRLFYQHDVSWIVGPAHGLRLLYFNNGGARPGGPYSSVEEIVLPFDPQGGFATETGEPHGPARPVWSYSDPPEFFSGFISGAQRLPNGNTLICEGAEGRLFEITPDGRVVWELFNPHGGGQEPGDVTTEAPAKAVFRATRLPADHPALEARGL